MSDRANTISDAVQRLQCRDPMLKQICLYNKLHIDDEIAELVNCLLDNPDIVIYMTLHGNRLTDEAGIKLARFLAASSSIRVLVLSGNRFSEATYLAIAAALRINTSLQFLHLNCNQVINTHRVDAAFIDALILNPNRPPDSAWWLYPGDCKFKELKVAAEKLGHPNMQALLTTQLI